MWGWPVKCCRKHSHHKHNIQLNEQDLKYGLSRSTCKVVVNSHTAEDTQYVVESTRTSVRAAYSRVRYCDKLIQHWTHNIRPQPHVWIVKVPCKVGTHNQTHNMWLKVQDLQERSKGLPTAACDIVINCYRTRRTIYGWRNMGFTNVCERGVKNYGNNLNFWSVLHDWSCDKTLLSLTALYDMVQNTKYLQDCWNHNNKIDWELLWPWGLRRDTLRFNTHRPR